MKTHPQPAKANHCSAFSLVELLVVIAVITMLMTLGSIGLSNLGGKGIAGGVSTAEALFDEAHTNAVSRNLRSAVLIAKTLTNNPADDLRRIVVAYEDTNEYGEPAQPNSPAPNWVLSSRGALLPEKTFFSEKFSKPDHSSGGGTIPTVSHSKLKLSPGPSGSSVREAYMGEWFIYEFNSQGISTTPGASFIIGGGARAVTRSSTEAPPRTTGSAKRDFGGFVIWRNGRTSVFRSPEQMGLPATVTEF
jgi:prepilin-type N-terminal cleavage/methylation domain-containing protein